MLQSFKTLKNQAGQTATEYMLIIAVVVLGAVAGASVLIPQFRNAVTTMAGQIAGTITGSSGNFTGTMQRNR